MTTLFKSYIPANARVVIDYKVNERVRFSYPRDWTYWKAVRKQALPTIVEFWLCLHIFLLVRILPILIVISVPTFFIYITLYPITIISEAYTLTMDWKFSLLFYIFFFYIVVVPLLFTYILALNKNIFCSVLPKIGHWITILMGDCNFKKFTPEDIYNNKAIIPHFSNVSLIYNAKEDFGKYLTKIEILDLPFQYKKRSFFYPIIRKPKLENNDYQFCAVFHFNKKPVTGSLEVEYV